MLILLCAFLLSGWVYPVYASYDIKFRRITINDGLSLSSVYCIYQDQKGFMWFATEDGLNKFDGANFTIYNHTPADPNSLSYKWIEQIREDPSGVLWLGSRHGLTMLDPSNDHIRRFYHDNEDGLKLINDTIVCMVNDGNLLWLGTMDGVNLVNTETLEVSELELDCAQNCRKVNTILIDKNRNVWIGTDAGLLSAPQGANIAKLVQTGSPGGIENEVFSLLEDQDTLWVATGNSIQKYIIPNNEVSNFERPLTNITLSEPVQAMFKSSRGHLWVSTINAVYRLEDNQLKKVTDTPERSPSLAINPHKPIIEDDEGNIWFGSFGDGLYKYDPDTGKLFQYMHDPTNDQSLSDNIVNCLFQDRSGAIWVGTFGAGISVYHSIANLIKTLQFNPMDPDGLSSNFIWSIYETIDQKIWIGTNNAGINIYDPVHEKMDYLVHDPEKPASLPDGSVRKIFQSADGTIWVGTDGGGLSKYNPLNRSFTQYRHDPSNPNSISSNSVRAIYQDSTGIMWIGTRNGLNKFNPRSGKFDRYLHDDGDRRSISNNFVYSAIYMDKQGFLWVGTYGGGLNRLDTRTGKFIRYMFDPDDPNSISDDIVFAIYEDEKGYFWIGTNSGLNLFNPSTGKFKRYGLEAGLPNEVVYGIMPDASNRIWMTTNKGISRLDLTSFRFKNFNVTDGLQSNEFNGGAYHRGHSGKLYAGGIYGLSIIDPELIVPVENNAELIISRLEIMGKMVRVVPPGMIVDNEENPDDLIESVENFYLPRHITYMNEVRLNYRQRFFSIQFAALNHFMPEKLDYRYRMQNLESHWNDAGNRNYVTYANMKPGTYVFEVDAVNPDGFSSKEPAQLKITITPPFWRSYWFMLIIAMVVMGIIIFIYRYLLNQRTNRLIKEQYAQIKIAHNQLQESEKNLKQLNATKDKFFSIISHDLKNPFTSVLSISELISKNFDATDTEELRYGIKKIHATNQHIYELLENLLTWSKTQRGNITVEEVKFNLSKIIETNINILKLAAEKKDIKIENQTPEDIYAVADREMISTVFRNLVNNSIKFTPPGKRVQITTNRSNNHVTVKVSDEGIGIPEEDQSRIFRIDEKFKTEGTGGEKGTGLGLIICKEFIEKNGGSIEFVSEPGKGTTFTFTLPADKNTE